MKNQLGERKEFLNHTHVLGNVEAVGHTEVRVTLQEDDKEIER